MRFQSRQSIIGNLVIAMFVCAALSIPCNSVAYSKKVDQAKDIKDAAKLSAKAATVFEDVMRVPDKAIPQNLLDKAEAIAVFPGVLKAAFVVGGEGGKGVVSKRTPNGWSAPVFFRAAGGSVGLQIGVSSTDLVLLFMNDEGLSQLLKDKVELGAEAMAAAGPVGRQASAGTDVLMKAEILSYSRSRGLFAGIDLKGVVIKPDDDLNMAVYKMKARDLLGTDDQQRGKNAAADLLAFPSSLERYSSKR
jgi:lipid-binding SYLF domain-containing protein